MKLAALAKCQHRVTDAETPGLEPFSVMSLGILLTSVSGSETEFTLLKSQAQVTLKDEPNHITLAAEGKRYDYVLRIMGNCLHATTYAKGDKRICASATFSTLRGAEEMLESIIADC